MSNKLVKKSNLGDLSYSDLGLDVSFQILEAPYLEDGTKMLFKIDDVENAKRGENTVISTADSKVKVMVIPTNEELAIARETKRLVG